MDPKDFVQFYCPCCAAKIYASPNAQVGHLCRKAMPRAKFVVWKQMDPT